MKFIDEANISVKAGDGGQGCAGFRREKHTPRGGPDGGDGGKGGDVAISGTKNLTSLLDFRYRRIFKAEKGKNGSGSNKKGRDGEGLLIHVPLGTIIFEEGSEEPLADITGERTLVLLQRAAGVEEAMPVLSVQPTGLLTSSSLVNLARKDSFIWCSSSLQMLVL